VTLTAAMVRRRLLSVAPARARGEIESKVEWEGRRMGVLMSWPAVPGRPRRMAVRSGDRRRAAYTRPSNSEPIEHCSLSETRFSFQMNRLIGEVDSV